MFFYGPLSCLQIGGNVIEKKLLQMNKMMTRTQIMIDPPLKLRHTVTRGKYGVRQRVPKT